MDFDFVSLFTGAAAASANIEKRTQVTAPSVRERETTTIFDAFSNFGGKSGRGNPLLLLLLRPPHQLPRRQSSPPPRRRPSRSTAAAADFCVLNPFGAQFVCIAHPEDKLKELLA